MSTVEIEPLDPFDTAAYDAFYDVYLAAERAAGDVGSPWMRDEVRIDLQEPATRRWIGGYVGRTDGRVVAVGQLSTPLLDNLKSATLAVHVAPDDRRRGFGSAVLTRLESEAAARGRDLVNAEASWSYDDGPDGAGQPGPAFAWARGFELGLSDVKRRLALPVDGGLLDARGDVVAFSDLVTTRHEPGRGYQWGTLVRSDARGHRLGLAVKVANQRLLQRERPDVRELITYNAEVNRHMIGVNERLGFVPVARLGEFQKRL